MIFQNVHIITGNLGADANLDVTSNGRRVLHLRVVTEFRTAHKGSTIFQKKSPRTPSIQPWRKARRMIRRST